MTALAPVGVSTLLDSWSPDVAGLVLLALLGVPYAVGVRRVRARDGRWPPGRTVLWVLGMACVAYVTVGGVGAYARTLFSTYAVQVAVLLVVAPVLLALGRPVALAVAALPEPAAGRVRRAFGGGLLAVFASPFVGPLLLPIALGLVFFSPLLRVSLSDAAVYGGLHVVLLALGLLFALPLAGDGLAMDSTALAVGVFVGFVELLLDAIPGLVIRLRTHLLAPEYFLHLARHWGPSPLSDQQIGGAILWCLGESLDIPVIALLVARWVRSDAAEAARVDRDLDVRRILPAPADAPAGASLPEPAGPPGAPELMRPWWETDPDRLGGHRAELLRRAARRRPGEGEGEG